MYHQGVDRQRPEIEVRTRTELREIRRDEGSEMRCEGESRRRGEVSGGVGGIGDGEICVNLLESGHAEMCEVRSRRVEDRAESIEKAEMKRLGESEYI